ncbi:hypothetical protein ACHAPU_010984 [Fusarium lateritium]
MELISNSVVTDRWRHTRQPPLPSEMQSTNILKVRIESASAKISAGSTTDDKSDLENEEVVNSTWTGVLPVYQTIGQPIPGPYNVVNVPEHVANFSNDTNEERKQRSLEAARGKRRAGYLESSV